MRKRTLIIIFFIFLLISVDTFSQCSMCRRVAETSNSNKTKSRSGLNTGILYLLAIPYVLGSIGVFVWYRNRKKS